MDRTTGPLVGPPIGPLLGPPIGPPIGPQGPPDEAPRRTIPEPDLVRAGVAAVLGMVLLALLIGTVGGFALLWLVTQMLAYVR